jgi:hypothetical protein
MTVTESPSAAAVATIVTTAPLSDHREPSVNAALHAALKAAVVGAAAMGLTWVRISRAVVLEDAVAVKIFATDTAPEPGAEEDGPDPNGGSSADVLEPAGLAL